MNICVTCVQQWNYGLFELHLPKFPKLDLYVGNSSEEDPSVSRMR